MGSMGVLVLFLLLYLSVFLHELGHFLAARRLGLTPSLLAVGAPPWLLRRSVRGIPLALGLLPLGGGVVIEKEEDLDRLPLFQVMGIFLAGPMVSLVLGLLTFILLGLVQGDIVGIFGRLLGALREVDLFQDASFRDSIAASRIAFQKLPPVQAVLLLFGLLNLGNALFNLLPLPPLDGGAALFFGLRRIRWGRAVYLAMVVVGVALILSFSIGVLVRDFWR